MTIVSVLQQKYNRRFLGKESVYKHYHCLCQQPKANLQQTGANLREGLTIEAIASSSNKCLPKLSLLHVELTGRKFYQILSLTLLNSRVIHNFSKDVLYCKKKGRIAGYFRQTCYILFKPVGSFSNSKKLKLSQNVNT